MNNPETLLAVISAKQSSIAVFGLSYFDLSLLEFRLAGFPVTGFDFHSGQGI